VVRHVIPLEHDPPLLLQLLQLAHFRVTPLHFRPGVDVVIAEALGAVGNAPQQLLLVYHHDHANSSAGSA